MTWDDELEQDYIPITEADWTPPRNRVPTVALVQLLTTMIVRNHRRAGRPGRLYDELRSRRYKIPLADIRLALRYIDPRISP